MVAVGISSSPWIRTVSVQGASPQLCFGCWQGPPTKPDLRLAGPSSWTWCILWRKAKAPRQLARCMASNKVVETLAVTVEGLVPRAIAAGLRLPDLRGRYLPIYPCREAAESYRHCQKPSLPVEALPIIWGWRNGACPAHSLAAAIVRSGPNYPRGRCCVACPPPERLRMLACFVYGV